MAGILLVVFSAVLSNSDEESALWERPWRFYFGVAAPCLFGLIIANAMTTTFSLLRPERVAVSIECCYQNVGIATSMALTMFDGDELAEAMGVPLFYGLVEMFILGIYCVVAWKAGWTKAPANVSLYKAVSTSYEIVTAEKAETGEGIIRNEQVDFTDGVGENNHDADQVELGGAFHYVQYPDILPANSGEEVVLGETGVRRASRPVKGLKEQSYIVHHGFN